MEITDSLSGITDDVSDSITRNSNNSNGSFTCPICMNEITDEEQCITECNHHFCRVCIHGWFDRSNVSCPSCRGEINYYINNLEKNHIVKVNLLDRNNPVIVNTEVEVLLNRVRFYHLILSINLLYALYSLYDGIQMNDQIDNYRSLYHNCTDALEEIEEIEQQYDMTSRVIVYFHQEYMNCEFPTYFLNQCIHYFGPVI